MAGATEGIDFVEGTLRRGFCFPAANLVVLSAAELFGRSAVHARRHLRRAERNRAQIDFSELNEGDLVVHLEHGIGKFLGLLKLPVAEGRAACEPVVAGASLLQRKRHSSKPKFSHSNLQMKRSSTCPSSKRTSFPAMSAREKNRRR